MHRHTSSEPKPTVQTPTPLVYKVPGFLKGAGKRNSGKNPFDYLGQFDTVFLIDDSESMIPAWNSVALALWRFLELAIAYDPDGVDLHFMSSDVSLQNARSASVVFSAFQDVQPHGSTFMNLALEKLLMDYIQRFRGDRERTKRLNLIVITDGDILSFSSPEAAIATCAQALDSALAPSCQVGVQFVLIGSKEEARRTFQDIDDNLGERNATR
jgi:Mg-chelatase subunit ChlD